MPGASVVFTVTGANAASGSAATDTSGVARFCYTGTLAGTDYIVAYADINRSGHQDDHCPEGQVARTFYLAGNPAHLRLAPKDDTNRLGQTHCVTAMVTDQYGNRARKHQPVILHQAPSLILRAAASARSSWMSRPAQSWSPESADPMNASMASIPSAVGLGRLLP